MTGTRLVLRLTVACATVLLILAPVFAASPAGAQAAAEWNVAMVGGPAAGSGVTIAVVDTGVDAGHPAFGGRVLPGIDLVDGDDDASDGHGHGTHVAGIAAGEGIICGDGQPSAIGVAPQTSILPVRVLDDRGEGSFEGVIAGIRAAADAGATIINLSLGDAGVPIPGLTDGWKREFREALTYAWNKGSIPVLASGNRNNDPLAILASGYGNDVKAVVVTALTDDGKKAGYANTADGYTWGVAAPGGSGGTGPAGNVLSALPDLRCGHKGGTSMAAPHVAAALAVLRSHGLSPQAAVDKLLNTAKPAGSGTGRGLIDMTAALQGVGVGGTNSTTSTTAIPTTATPTTVSAGGGPTTSTTGATTSSTTPTSTTSVPETTTTTTVLKGPLPLPDDDDDTEDDELAEDMSLDVEDDDGSIPAAAALGASLAAGLVWIGWVAAFRRTLGS